MTQKFTKFKTTILAIIGVAICLFCLSSCIKKPKRIAQLLERIETEKLQLDTHHKITIPAPLKISSWQDPINTVNIGNLSVAGDLSQLYTTKIVELKGKILTDPVIAENKIFLITKNGYIKAYDEVNHKPIWSYTVKTDISRSTNAILKYQDGLLYVVFNQNFLTLSALDGHEICYKMFASNIASGICVEGDTTYLKDAFSLYAINIRNNQILWNIHGISDKVAIESKISPILHSSEMLLTNHFSGQLAFINPLKMGQRVLNIRQQLGKSPVNLPIVNIANQPILTKNFLYFATHSGMVQKYDIAKRKPDWHIEIPCVQRLVKIGNTLFVLTFTGQLAAINADNGKTAWVTNLPIDTKVVHEFLQPLCINSKIVLLSRTGHLITLSPQTGQILSLVDLKISDIVSMAVINDQLKVFAQSGKVLTTDQNILKIKSTTWRKSDKMEHRILTRQQ